MKKSNKPFAVLLALAMTALTGFAALAFANNVSVIVRWWRAFAAAGGDTARIPASVSGVIAALDWATVDYSAVTTFIPFLGFLCLAVSAWRLVFGARVAAADFPFFRGSDQLNVALGLFGTLWGIIVIGYFQLDTVKMADLMQCLHTALFSTLMAVVWVFMIDRPLLRPLFLRLALSLDCVAYETDDVEAAVERLTRKLNDMADAFERRQREYDEVVTKQIAELKARAETAEAKVRKVADALGA